jgi:diacylglycerol kinase (ATP)
VKAVVIRNGAAGAARRKRESFAFALDVLDRAGWQLQVTETTRAGHAIDIATQAVADGAEVVVAAGGDGTVNEVVQALAHTEVALAALPMGTVNVWCREAGFSSGVRRAARQIRDGVRMRVDLGLAGDRYFLLMAGIGLDAEVTATLGSGARLKQQLRILPYVLRTAQVLPRYKGGSFEIELDGISQRDGALMLLASNTRLYGNLGKPNPDAIANDGLLDIRVFRGSGARQSVRHLAGLFLNSEAEDSDFFRAERIAVEATPPLAVQVDGDPIGTTPIEITVQPRALAVILPADFDRSLVNPTFD